MDIKIENLKKIFFSLRGEVSALKNVNLEIRDKEFFVLLGPSGCGKSTLLNLIAGLEKPTGGAIKFGQNMMASREGKIFKNPRERNVSFVFQNYALYPHMKVFDNIAFPLKVVKTPKREIREEVENAARILEISELLDVKPKELSGGQRQRVAIARAIVRKPNVFLLDEPLSNLDAQLRVSMRAELKELQRRLGITTIYVTHDQVEAMSLGDRIAVLKAGRIEQIGSPSELYDSPRNKFVAKFVGSPPMNLIRTQISEEEGACHVILGGQKVGIPGDKAKEMKERKKREIIFGIRPEHIRIRTEKEDFLEGKIRSVEPMGRESLLHVTVGDVELFVLSEKDVSEEEKAYLEIDARKAYFFEGENEKGKG